MSIDASGLRKLAALGLSQEQMSGVLDVLASMTEKDEERKAAQRERTRKFREKIGVVTLQSHHGNSDTSRASVTRGEDKPLTQKIEPQESKKEQSAQARLEGVLDPEHAKAVIDHRQRLRKPLTAYAARLLADKLASFPDPNGAVDRMIERGWQTVYPDDGSPQARGSPPRKSSLADAFGKIAELAEYRNEARRSEGFGSAQAAIPHLSRLSDG